MLLRKTRDKKLIVALMVTWAGLFGCIPTGASAMPVGSQEASEAALMMRNADMEKAHTLLTNAAIMHRLAKLGLSKDDAEKMLSRLSAAQLHKLALKADEVKAGGSGSGLAIALVVLLIVAFFCALHLTGHRLDVSIERKPQAKEVGEKGGEKVVK